MAIPYRHSSTKDSHIRCGLVAVAFSLAAASKKLSFAPGGNWNSCGPEPWHASMLVGLYPARRWVANAMLPAMAASTIPKMMLSGAGKRMAGIQATKLQQKPKKLCALSVCVFGTYPLVGERCLEDGEGVPIWLQFARQRRLRSCRCHYGAADGP
jgi:hypothetical protein